MTNRFISTPVKAGDPASAPRVLMLGNSLTTSNRLPALLDGFIGGEVVVHARGGARLSEHLNPKTKLGAMTQAAFAEGGWTHVVLQERSDGPVRFREAYLRSVAALCGQVREIGAVPVVYATWAYAPGCPKLQGLGHDCEGMHTALQSAFAEAAESYGAILANVGEAFFESNGAEALYGSDGVHPSDAGTLLATEVLANSIAGMRG